MSGATRSPLDRPKPSAVLRKVREARLSDDLRDPAARMQAAFSLSIAALKLRRAALIERGEAVDEILNLLHKRY